MAKEQEQLLPEFGNEYYQPSDIVDILDKINSFVSISDMGEEPQPHVALTDYSDSEALREAGFGDAQIMEIQRGQALGVDVRRFARLDYNWMQMREIRFGLAQGVDVKYFENEN